MAKGGARANAGRKPGVPNKRTAEKTAEIEASGLTPLDYMLSMLRDDSLEPMARFEAAKAAAPYVHAKLAAVEFSGGLSFSHEDALAELDDPEGKSDSAPAEIGL